MVHSTLFVPGVMSDAESKDEDARMSRHCGVVLRMIKCVLLLILRYRNAGGILCVGWDVCNYSLCLWYEMWVRYKSYISR